MPGVWIAVAFVQLVGIGLLVLWAGRAVELSRGTTARGTEWVVTQLVGWALVAIGVLALQFQVLVYFSPLAWLATFVLALVAYQRYRGGERRSFVWCLAAAAERGIPLTHSARAFAVERRDGLGASAIRLANLMDRGVSLPEALSRTWFHVPFDILLAVRLGTETNDLPGALASLAWTKPETEGLIRSILEKLVYLLIMSVVLLGIVTFLMLKIVPVFDRMFYEFDLKLPQLTQLVIAVSYWGTQYWFLLGPLWMLLFFLAVIGMLYYVNLLPRDLPVLNRLTLRWDRALVLRSLALAVRRQRTFEDMLRLLSVHYPRGSVRNRLRSALQKMQSGEPWASSLRQAGLLGASEEPVVSAAQRAGNLAWALEEMADSSLRRIGYRLRLLSSVVLPLFFVALGMLISAIVVSLFIPMVSLIQGLS
jgi:type II secretory pathway component PulF